MEEAPLRHERPDCGAVDPGVLLYLLQHEGITPGGLQHALCQKSGLLGVSETIAANL
ncbi:hypothetical protein ACFOHJ_00080 [Aquamicrobium soli]|uniref:Uncharacterized protein n=1 Tax=Aquamicrobium soli TaxID=1811518 RepID=A0ABV7K5M8_9HYPH